MVSSQGNKHGPGRSPGSPLTTETTQTRNPRHERSRTARSVRRTLTGARRPPHAWRQPATCPSCETREPNRYLLRQNHGYDLDGEGIGGFPTLEHPIYGSMCVAQSLVSNHIDYAVKQDRAH